MKEYLKLIRVKHYLKNLLIFLPLVFSGNILHMSSLIPCLLGFISFCLICSTVYIINDIKDVEADRKNETKKNRPLASEKISIKNAIILACVLFVLSMVLNYFAVGLSVASILAWSLLLLYLVLNVAYSFGLKRIPIVDIVILVSGFLIRVLYGAAITQITISNWLYLTVISGAFYLGLGKRRNELASQGSKSRDVLKKYNKDFLDKNMYICVALCIVFYALWCVDPLTVIKIESNLLIWTVPIVMIIFMKYSLNIENESSSGDPVEVLYGDKLLLSIVALFCLFLVAIIYIL